MSTPPTAHHRLVLSLLAYAAQRGLSVPELAALAGFDLPALQRGTAPPPSVRQLADLWHHAGQRSHDPLFGLHLGESLQLAALGVVGELVRSSRTVGEALTHAAAYTALVTDWLTLEVTRAPGTFAVRLRPTPASAAAEPAARRQLQDLLLALVLHEVDGLVLRVLRPRRAWLRYSSPAELVEYQRVLRGAAVEASEEYGLEFDDQYWDEPILTASYELQRELLHRAGQQAAALEEEQPIGVRISRYLLANAALGVPTLEDLAANFNVSPRSLQRRLQQEQLSYQQLADDTRRQLALHYLQAGRRPLKEVSYMLGYNELSAFSRAFKRWTGLAPVQYQQRAARAETSVAGL
jgi:AraC-like DNA-binding protein